VNTGDSVLMAAEAGARVSGMEFSNYYGIVPVGGSVDKNGYLLQSSFFDAAGREVHLGWSSQYGVMGTGAAACFAEGPVYCQFTQVSPERRPLLRAGQPNLFTQFDCMGIDPFAQKFEVEPMFEGSVRGSGGVLVTDAGLSGKLSAGRFSEPCLPPISQRPNTRKLRRGHKTNPSLGLLSVDPPARFGAPTLLFADAQRLSISGGDQGLVHA
jgi:succinate dehydrogenase/fumarate reductase flavoprotein subunit